MSSQENASSSVVVNAGGGGSGPPAVYSTANIQKLNGANFLPWRRQIEIILKLRGLASAISSDEQDVAEIIDMQAVLVMLETMDDQHKLQVQAEPDAKAIMRSLERQYANATAANKHNLLSRFFKACKNSSDSIHQHLGKMKELRASLVNLGEQISDDVFQITLIHSVGSEFPDLLQTWEITHPELKNTEFLINMIQQREANAKPAQSTTAATGNHQVFAARTKEQRREWYNSLSIDEKKKVSVCKGCKVRGHWLGDPPCTLNSDGTPKASGGKDAAKQSKPTLNVAFSLGDVSGRSSKAIIADSGATEHMFNEAGMFDELKLYEEPEKCSVGDGSEIPVLGVGTVKLKFLEDVTGTLQDVLFVPSLAVNIVSIGRATDKGIVATFTNTEVVFRKGDAIIARANRLTHSLYEINAKVITKTECMTVRTRIQGTMNKLHKVFGHASTERIRKLAEDKEVGLKIIEEQGTEDHELCGDCPPGKAKHVDYPSSEREREAQVGGRVHADLSGMINKASYEGFKYYLLCKDETSEFTHIFFVREKSEVWVKIDELITTFERESKFPIERLHTDNGTEFVNGKMEAMLAKERILHTTSSPYTPQQNGIIEREMGSINNTLRTLMHASSLPLELWPEAARTACYVRNILPTKNSNLTPYERYYGRKPFVGNMVEFGTQAHVLVNWNYLSKLDVRTSPGYIVGYTQRRNTYRVYMPHSKRTIETAEVILRPHQTKAKLVEEAAERKNEEAQIQVPQTNQAMEWQGGKDSSNEATRDQEYGYMSQPIQGSRTSLYGEELEELTVGPAVPSEVEPGSPALTSASPQRDEVRASQIASPDRDRSPFVPSFNLPREGPTTSPSDEDRSPFVPTFTLPRDLIRPTMAPTSRSGPGNSQGPPTPPRNSSLSRDEDRRPNMFSIKSKIKALPANEPGNFEEATKGPNADSWIQAIKEELDAHARNKTWVVVDRPNQGTALTTKWVFKIKQCPDGSIERYKARLVARGFQQREGLDYTETFAPVVKIDSIRILLATAALRKYAIELFDVSTAFLNGRLEEEIYVEPPLGLEVDTGRCLRLIKSLYGLKQAPRVWNSLFDHTMRELEFTPLEIDSCTYTSTDQTLIVTIYVDDGIVMGKSREKCLEVIARLNEKFKTNRTTGSSFLGMELIQEENAIMISQQRYVMSMLARYKMDGATATTSPMHDANELLDETKFQNEEMVDKAYYQSIIGSLQYAANMTRPDIQYAVNILSRKNSNPRLRHLTAAKRVLRYLKGTNNLALRYEAGDLPAKLEAFCDSDYAGDASDRKSTSGGIILGACAPIVYFSRKQNNIAQSTCEAELAAGNELTKELMWTRHFLDSLGVPYAKPILYMDNIPAIRIIKNNDIKRRTKHIQISQFYVREQLRNEYLEIEHIESEKQAADFLTKPLPGPKLIQATRRVGLTETTQPRRMSGSVLLTLFSVLIATTLCDGQQIQLIRGSETVWHKTSHVVVEGTTEFRLDYAYVSPCKGVAGLNAKGIEGQWTSKSYKHLEQLCNTMYEGTWLPQLERLLRCTPHDKHTLHRSERFVPLLAPAITTIWGAVSTAVLGTNVVFTVKHENRLNDLDSKAETQSKQLSDHEEKLKQQNDRIKLLEELDREKASRDTIRLQEINKLRQAIEQMASEQNSTSEVIIKLNERIQRNKESIDEIGNMLPEFSLNTANLANKFHSSEGALKIVERSCRTQRVATPELLDLTHLQLLQDFREEDTHLLNISRMDNQTITFYFTATRPAINASVLQLTTFDVWRNIDIEPHLFTYSGPEYVLYNSTSNCTIGIDKPEVAKVMMQCIEQNYYDERLLTWKKLDSESKEFDEKNKTQVKVLNTSIRVYCLYGSIYFGDNKDEIPCPNWPIDLPLNITWRSGNYSHKATRVHASTQHEVDPLMLPEHKPVPVDQSYLELMGLAAANKVKHDRIRELMKEVESHANDTIRTVPILKEQPQVTLDMTSVQIIAAGMIGLGITTTLSMWLCTRKSQVGSTQAPQQSLAPNYTIVTTTAPPPNQYERVYENRDSGYHYPRIYTKLSSVDSPVLPIEGESQELKQSVLGFVPRAHPPNS